MGKRENFFLESWHSVPWHYTHPVQSEEKIRPQQQEQQLAFTYNLWQGNIEAGSLRSCPNGFSPPSSRRKVVTCEKCNNLGSLSLTCSRWTTETGRITEEENHYRKRGAVDFPTPFWFLNYVFICLMYSANPLDYHSSPILF